MLLHSIAPVQTNDLLHAVMGSDLSIHRGSIYFNKISDSCCTGKIESS